VLSEVTASLCGAVSQSGPHVDATRNDRCVGQGEPCSESTELSCACSDGVEPGRNSELRLALRGLLTKASRLGNGEFLLNRAQANALKIILAQWHGTARCRLVLFQFFDGPITKTTEPAVETDAAMVCGASFPANSAIASKGTTHASSASTALCSKRRRLCAAGRLGTPPVTRRMSMSLLQVSGTSATEASARELRKAALELHSSKPTYGLEKSALRERIFPAEGSGWHTYVLFGDAGFCMGIHGSRPTYDKSSYFSAITLRVNEYADCRYSRWAQILNMSSRIERRGYGSRLFQEVESRMGTLENVDVFVCYPADASAAAFWSACGFKLREESLLPERELVPFVEGGCLIVEVNGSTGVELPRWEKRVGDPLPRCLV